MQQLSKPIAALFILVTGSLIIEERFLLKNAGGSTESL
jgi:hypothetical protein